MKHSKRYRIDIFGLKLGVHDFQFAFDHEIFDHVENSAIESGQGSCSIVLDKKETLISMHFDIEGELELVCDRSLEPFQFKVKLDESLILNYGEEFDDSRDDIWVIPNNQESIDVESFIYQYLSLAVPMKKLHPDFETDEDEELEELELVYSSEDESDDLEKEENETVDPRWAALKGIKNLEQ